MKASSGNTSGSQERRVSQVIFADSMQAQQPSLRLTDVLRRQRWVILCCISLGLALAGTYWTKAKIWYESSAKILVSQRDPRLATSSASSASQTEDMVDEDVLANHMEVVRSRTIVDGALKRHSLNELPSVKEHLKKPSQDSADYVIDHLKLSRGGEGTARDARSLTIQFEHTDPDDTRLILEAIVSEYQLFLGEQLEKAMSQANTMVTDARDKLEDELEAAQEEYINARQGAPILFQGGGSSNVYLEQYNRLHEEMLTLDIRESTSKARLEKAKTVFAKKAAGESIDYEDLGVIDTESMARLGVFAGLQANAARSSEFLGSQPERLEQAQTTSELLKMEAELGVLKADLGIRHPDVRKLEEQIEFVKTRMRERAAGIASADEDIKLTPEGLLQAYIAYLENQVTDISETRTELGILLADAEKQARVLVEFELKEGILKSRMERTQALFDGLVEQLRELDLASGMHGYVHELLETPRKGVQIWPSLPLCGIGGMMMGLVFGLFAALMNDQLDQRFRSSSEIDSAIGLPILSRVGRIRTDGNLPIVLDNSPEGEAFRMLRTLLLNDIRSGKLKVLSATSPLPGDGKTTILANVAATFAKLNMTVVLIEADMRRPTFHKRFGVPDDLGLADFLKGRATVEEVLLPSGVQNLSLITAGSGAANPSELLQHEAFDQLLKGLSERYQLVIVDVGPVLAVSDPVIVAQKSDGMLLVVRSSSDTKQQVMDAVETLRSAGAKMLGCIVNTYGSGNEFERPGYYGYYYSDRERNGRVGESVQASAGAGLLSSQGSDEV